MKRQQWRKENFERSWDDRFRPERDSLLETYRQGRMALILHFDSAVIPILPVLRISGQRDIHHKHGSFLVLKANLQNPHKLQHWDEKLVLVPNIQFLKCPQGEIASLVGLYCFQYEFSYLISNPLLFQSFLELTYKLLPRVENWESSPLGGTSSTLSDSFAPENIQSTTEIVKNVSDDDSQVLLGEMLDLPYLYAIYRQFPFQVFLDDNLVEIRGHKRDDYVTDLADVLIGPLNLQP